LNITLENTNTIVNKSEKRIDEAENKINDHEKRIFLIEGK